MIRIGHGYDVHKLVEGRELILGGEHIPHRLGLLGHSDADVLLHAISDAILGALALGDIGKHFPDTNPAYEDADSLMLLQKVMVRNGFLPIDCEWWHFTLEQEPYPETYFEFPVSSKYLKKGF